MVHALGGHRGEAAREALAVGLAGLDGGGGGDEGSDGVCELHGCEDVDGDRKGLVRRGPKAGSDWGLRSVGGSRPGAGEGLYGAGGRGMQEARRVEATRAVGLYRAGTVRPGIWHISFARNTARHRQGSGAQCAEASAATLPIKEVGPPKCVLRLPPVSDVACTSARVPSCSWNPAALRHAWTIRKRVDRAGEDRRGRSGRARRPEAGQAREGDRHRRRAGVERASALWPKREYAVNFCDTIVKRPRRAWDQQCFIIDSGRTRQLISPRPAARGGTYETPW